VTSAGVDVGIDQNNVPHPSVGFSLAALEQEADSIGIRVNKCQIVRFLRLANTATLF
jgi:hypothetical protein